MSSTTASPAPVTHRPPVPEPVRVALTVAVIGPSASGKSSVVRELARRGVVTVHPTWTTRPRRDDEVDGSLEHRFVSDAAFDQLRDDGFFHETVELFGLQYRYGIPPHRSAGAGTVDLVMVRAPLVERFRHHVPSALVYLVEGDERQAERWLTARGCQADDLAARVRDNAAELDLGRQLADRTFRNDDTVTALADRITAAFHTDRRVAQS